MQLGAHVHNADRGALVLNRNRDPDALASDRPPRKSILALVSKVLECSAGSADVHLGFGQPVVDLLYLCRIGADEGLDLHEGVGVSIPPALDERRWVVIAEVHAPKFQPVTWTWERFD